ncbi:MAG: histidine kinase [Chloroflexi bacterium]|nr:histidine kinase [Chloroflexota bacterium]
MAKSERTRQKRKSGSLRSRMLLTIVLPITVLLITFASAFVFGAIRLTQTLIQERDAQLVKLASSQVASYWYDSVLLLTQIAANQTVREGDPEASLEVLSANLTLSQRFDEVAITDPQGSIIVATGNVTESLLINQPWIERSGRLKRPVLSSVFYDSLGHQLLCVSIPIFDNNGLSSGYAIGIWRLDSDRLGRPIANISIGQAGSAYLIDNDGTILYHPDKSLVGVRDLEDPAYIAFKEQPGVRTLNIENTLRVIGYAPIPFQQLGTSLFADESWGNWNLVINESLGDILAPLQPYLPLLLILAGLMIILPSLIVWMSAQKIAAPLQSLAAQAGRVASGEFSDQVTITSGPQEVRELEEAFNTMVEQLRSYRGDIQNYVVSILNSQEQERKRIARDLHDETAQALIVLGRRIESLQDIHDPKELATELESVRDMVDDTLQGVRSFTSDLRPPLLSELGLARTLQLLGDRTEREESFTVSVDITGEARKLPDELELGLYRLAQESLSNVRRHAQAKHVRLVLQYEPRLVVLEVVDDGVGFDAPTNMNELVRAGRLGLMGILERARLFGGRAQIISKPGGGTTIRIVIPIEQGEREEITG